MPILPHRDIAEARLAGIIRVATRRQKERLANAMGWPPDVSRIPAALWLEIEREQAGASWGQLAVIYLTGAAVLSSIIQVATGYAPEPAEVAEDAIVFGHNRADELAADMATHTRERLETVARKMGTGEVEKPEFEEIVKTIFGEKRADTVAKTETTGAHGGGERNTTGRFEGDNPGSTTLAIWRHRGGLEAGVHPCPLCAPLVGMSQLEWPAIDPDAGKGPPRHPNCDCTLEWMIITNDEAQRLPMTPPRGWDRPYEDQFKRIRDSRGPRDKRGAA